MNSNSASVVPVTVVIPVYNRESLIEETIRAVQGQVGCRPAEILVVDDASTDGTVKAASRTGVQVVALEINGGAAAARNAGLALVATEWVAFLDSDDRWLPSCVETLWVLREPGEVFVSGAAAIVTDGAVVGAMGTPHDGAQRIASPAVPLRWVGQPLINASILKTATVRRIGGFSTSYRYSEDLDFWIRLLEVGTGRCVPQVVTAYRRHSGSKSGQSLEAAEQRCGIAKDHAGATWSSTALVERYVGGTLWNGARDSWRSGNRATGWLLFARSLAGIQRIWGVAQLVHRNLRIRKAFRALPRSEAELWD